MTIFLKTARLTLHAPTLADFDNLYALQSDNEVMQFIGNGVRSREEVRSGLEKAINHQNKYGFSLGNVYENDTGNFIGRAGLVYLGYDDTQPEIEFGYALTKNAWNKGYATELSNALIDWGFTNLAIEKLVAVINPKNDPSRRVLEKVGMDYVGRAHYWNQDVALYQIQKSVIDYSKVKLKPATIEDYPTMQNLGLLYVYDISEFMGKYPNWEIPANGQYACNDFKKYFENNQSFPFLVYYGDELAGFLIVDNECSSAEIEFNMAQFFILRKFKHKGLGKQAAQQAFKKFPGVWEVMVIPGNEAAYQFWRSVIKLYTHNNFIEYTKDVAQFRRNIFKFISFNSKE